MRRKTKAQSVTEYAILLGVAIAVFAGMQLYVKRGLNARIKQATDAATTSGPAVTTSLIDFDITAQDGITASGGRGSGLYLGRQEQYEPYYTESRSDTYQENVERERLSDGQIEKEIVSQISGQAAGSYRAEKTVNGTDSNWGEVY
jgi:hypothetical protein